MSKPNNSKKVREFVLLMEATLEDMQKTINSHARSGWWLEFPPSFAQPVLPGATGSYFATLHRWIEVERN